MKLRSSAVQLALAFAVAACSKSPAPSPSAMKLTPSSGPAVTITAKTAQAQETLNIAGLAPFALLERDLPLPLPASVRRLDADRIAYKTANGERIAYVRHSEIFFGALAPTPTAADSAEALEDAREHVFAESSAQRAAITRMLAHEPAAARLRFARATFALQDDSAWAQRFAELGPAEQQALRKQLAEVVLDRAASTKGLARALAYANLEPSESVQNALIERMQRLGTAPDADGPLAAAILLRKAAKPANRDAALTAHACQVVSDFAQAGANAPGDVLVGSALALLVVSKTPCGPAATILAATGCHPSVRCANGAALTPSSPSKQLEPLCSLAELSELATRELAREPADLIANPFAPLPALAYALVLQAGAPPTTFADAHARRLYALSQAAKPECESTEIEGRACHCNEASLRDAACRSTGSRARAGSCAFEIDATKKSLVNVQFTRSTLH